MQPAEKSKRIQALGHKVVVEKAVAATCTEDGLTEGRYCETCGAVFSAQKAVKATGHKEVIDKEINATYFTL